MGAEDSGHWVSMRFILHAVNAGFGKDVGAQICWVTGCECGFHMFSHHSTYSTSIAVAEHLGSIGLRMAVTNRPPTPFARSTS